jgi:hypothetical protein
VGHQVDVGRHVGNVVGDHQVHADEVTANFGPPVADAHARAVHQAVVGQHMAGVGVDDHFIDVVDRQQGVQHPAEQRLAAEARGSSCL